LIEETIANVPIEDQNVNRNIKAGSYGYTKFIT